MDPTNHNTALASAFTEELARCGVRHAVLSPGSRSTPYAVALSREEGIDLTVIVDERSAGFFALGAAQATRSPVVILCTSGTAAANLHPAVAEAHDSNIPMIVLTADRPPELRGIGAGPTIDQIKLYGSSVRWFSEVGTHDADDAGLLHVRSIACRAFGASRGDSRPGPVHLNLALREPLAPIEVEGGVTASDPLALEGRDERPLTASTDFPAGPRTEILDMLAERITGSESGVIIAGRQTDTGLREPLAALAAAAGMPILTDPLSQMRSGPHDRSYVVSAYDSLLRADPIAERKPDLALRFGDMPTSKPLRAWLARPGIDQIVLAGTGGWNEPTNRAAAMIRGDLVAIAAGLAERCGKGDAKPKPTGWLDADTAAWETLSDAMARSEAPGEPALYGYLANNLRDGDLVYTASSMPIRDQESFSPSIVADVMFLANRGANGIDGLVASGIGAAHATGRPTTIISGDIGMLHDIGSLALVRSAETPVRIVIINNGGGRIFDHLPQTGVMASEEFEELLATPREVDFAAAAKTFGLSHARVDDLSLFPEALHGEDDLIEVRFSSDGAAIRAELHAAVSGALEERPS